MPLKCCGRASAHSIPRPPLNFPASLAIGWGHVTSLGQKAVVESEMYHVKVKAVKSLCVSPHLFLYPSMVFLEAIHSWWSSHEMKEGSVLYIGLCVLVNKK